MTHVDGTVLATIFDLAMLHPGAWSASGAAMIVIHTSWAEHVQLCLCSECGGDGQCAAVILLLYILVITSPPAYMTFLAPHSASEFLHVRRVLRHTHTLLP